MAKSNDVHEAQEELIKEGFLLRGPDIDDMRKTKRWFDPSKIHPTKSGMREQSNRWFKILKDKI